MDKVYNANLNSRVSPFGKKTEKKRKVLVFSFRPILIVI